MPLKSMTGFGRSEGSQDALTWIWEVRSVNGRGLDVRFRLPPGMDALEPRARELIQPRIARGSVNVTLSLARAGGDTVVRLDPTAARAIVDAADHMQKLLGGRGVLSIDGLLAMKGVLEYVEPSLTDAERAARDDALLASLADAVTQLGAARQAEGERLEAAITQAVDDVARLAATVAASPARTPEAIGRRLREQVDRLMREAGSSLDPARLHQEAMVLATRIDVEEELKRLAAHIAAARDLLAASEPTGRKFDFLTQEFNREANTLCAKANDVDITRAGLAMKAVIDQMREQVQNIE